MWFQVSCKCGRQLKLDEQYAGREVCCPVCKRVFLAPRDQAAADQEWDGKSTYRLDPADRDEEPPAPPPRPLPRRRPEPEDEEPPAEPRPRRRRERPPARPRGEWVRNLGQNNVVNTVAVVLIIAGAAIDFTSIQSLRLAATASSKPQTLTLAQLVARGPGDNAHVLVTDFVPAQNYVYSKKNGIWQKVYFPFIPVTPEVKARLAAGQEPGIFLRPRAVHVLVIPVGVTSEATANQWADGMASKQQLRGMVVNLIESVDGKTRDLLQETYPDTDFSRCLIVREGKRPTTAGAGLTGVVAGTFLFVLGGFWFGLRLVYRERG